MTVDPPTNHPGGEGSPAGSRHCALEALLAGATREVLMATALLPAPRGRAVAVGRVDRENLGRGVRYRVVVPDRARLDRVAVRELGLLARAGAQLRTVPVVPTDSVVIDAARVVVPEEAAGFAVLDLPGVVTTAVELFDLLWSSGTPWAVEVALPSAREREVLALLSTGCTDEAVGARLGISVRTVRRVVSTTMTRLGARSRFQAGARAADLGWLTTGGGPQGSAARRRALT